MDMQKQKNRSSKSETNFGKIEAKMFKTVGDSFRAAGIHHLILFPFWICFELRISSFGFFFLAHF